MIIDQGFLDKLSEQAKASPRLRMNYDLRNSAEDTSQRMLNALEPGTQVAIHRHVETSETVVCLRGEVTVVFFEEYPNMDAGGPVHDLIDSGCMVLGSGLASSYFYETARVKLSPREGTYGVQVPKGAWHTVEVKVSSIILETKDGAYKG